MIHSYLNSTVYIIRKTVDKYNQVQSTGRTQVSARTDWIQRLIRVTNGQDKLASATVYMAAGIDVRPTDLIEINGTPYEIVKIFTLDDFSPDHIEVVIA